jgi:hypothetical protein
MIDISYTPLMEQVRRGAFLTVEHDGELNTMTIGWFQLGFFWGREIMTVGVRPTRFTHHIIDEVTNYSVTIPAAGTFSKEIALCGSKSGKDIDKFAVCNLPVKKKDGNIPYIPIPGEHLFGKIVFKTVMQPGQITEDLHKHYPQNDFHTLYMAEIVDHIRVAR